jgi:hypothetical protein
MVLLRRDAHCPKCLFPVFLLVVKVTASIKEAEDPKEPEDYTVFL